MRFNGLLFAIVIILSGFGVSFSQSTPRTVSLIVGECIDGEGVCYTEQLVRYKFQNGKLVEREIILRVDTEKSDVGFNIGKNHLYQNRYVITNWADIIDIKTKKILHVGKGEFIAVENDRVIEKINREKLSTGQKGTKSFEINAFL